MLRSHNRVLSLAMSVPLAFAGLAACDSDDSTPVEEDPLAEQEEHVCEHFNDGPVMTVTAGATAAQAATIDAMHTRWDVTLGADGAGGYVGYVAIAADETTTYALFVGDGVTLAVKDATGAAVVPSFSKTGSDVCEPLGAWFKIPVAVGSYVVELKSASVQKAELVYGEPGHDEHESE